MISVETVLRCVRANPARVRKMGRVCDVYILKSGVILKEYGCFGRLVLPDFPSREFPSPCLAVSVCGAAARRCANAHRARSARTWGRCRGANADREHHR